MLDCQNPLKKVIKFHHFKILRPKSYMIMEGNSLYDSLYDYGGKSFIVKTYVNIRARMKIKIEATFIAYYLLIFFIHDFFTAYSYSLSLANSSRFFI